MLFKMNVFLRFEFCYVLIILYIIYLFIFVLVGINLVNFVFYLLYIVIFLGIIKFGIGIRKCYNLYFYYLDCENDDCKVFE